MSKTVIGIRFYDIKSDPTLFSTENLFCAFIPKQFNDEEDRAQENKTLE